MRAPPSRLGSGTPTAWRTYLLRALSSRGEFIVGTANAFVSEMLEHRMYPLIERAIEHVIGEPTSVRFQVAAASSATVNAPAEVPPLAAEGSERQAPSAAASEPAVNARPPSLNGRYTFDRFIVGKSNELAHAAAQAVAG